MSQHRFKVGDVVARNPNAHPIYTSFWNRIKEEYKVHEGTQFVVYEADGFDMKIFHWTMASPLTVTPENWILAEDFTDRNLEDYL